LFYPGYEDVTKTIYLFYVKWFHIINEEC